MEAEKLTVCGKRKCAVAKASITKGNGAIIINNIPYENLAMFHRLLIREPVDITKNVLGNFDFDIRVKVMGGGSESQIEASRLAVAKAVFKFSKSPELRRAFLDYDRNLLVADIRRKEPYKPGDSKARAKRQKSYR